MVSWRNPTAEDRDKGMADYINAVEERRFRRGRGDWWPEQKVHAMGYCLGGHADDGQGPRRWPATAKDRLASLTPVGDGRVDFTRTRRVCSLFISESEGHVLGGEGKGEKQ